MQNTLSVLVSKLFNRFKWNLKPRYFSWWCIIWIKFPFWKNQTRHLWTVVKNISGKRDTNSGHTWKRTQSWSWQISKSALTRAGRKDLLSTNKSAITDYVVEHNPVIRWKEGKVIGREQNRHKCRIKETISHVCSQNRNKNKRMKVFIDATCFVDFQINTRPDSGLNLAVPCCCHSVAFVIRDLWPLTPLTVGWTTRSMWTLCMSVCAQHVDTYFFHLKYFQILTFFDLWPLNGISNEEVNWTIFVSLSIYNKLTLIFAIQNGFILDLWPLMVAHTKMTLWTLILSVHVQDIDTVIFDTWNISLFSVYCLSQIWPLKWPSTWKVR